MTEILIAMVSWLAINLITRLSWKLWVSKTYVSVLLCLVIGALLYAGQALINKYPLAREQIVWIASGSYAFSQMCYSLAKKRWIIEKEK